MTKVVFFFGQYDSLAQPVEHLTFNQGVWSSILQRVTIYQCGCSSMVELQPSKLTTWVRFPSPAPLIFCTFYPFCIKETFAISVIYKLDV